MGTKCKFNNGIQVFSGQPMMVSAGGIITSNQQVADTGTETVVLTETIYGNTLNATTMSFRAFMAGEISSSGAEDITLTLRYGTTDIVALTTVTLIDEDDKPFKAEWTGHILTTGATGKINASAWGTFFQATPLYYAADTALAGVTADLTANSSFNITAHWDGADADSDIIVTHGWIQFYN